MIDAKQFFKGDAKPVNGHILENKTQRVTYEEDFKLLHIIPSGVASAERPGNFEPLPTSKEDAMAIILINTHHINETDNSIALNDAAVLAYFRFLLFKYKLTSPQYDPGAYFVDYNQCVYLKDPKETAGAILADNDEVIKGDRKHLISTAIGTVLTAAARKELNTVFCNTICLLAYMFRTRGHHFFDEFVPKLDRLWGKTVTSNLQIRASWKNLFTVGFHAVIPSILDDFWTYCKDNSMCDDILKLRWDSASAGTAAFGAIRQGMNDLFSVLPNIRARVKDSADYIDTVCEKLKANRWAHCINARFYDADVNRLDEKPVAVIAAMIRATLDAVAAGAPLLESKAMERAANNAPIAGAIFASAVRNLIRSERFLALLNEDTPS
jgi:hypothetical protein